LTSPIDTELRFIRDRQIEEAQFHWLVGILEGEGTFVRAAPSSPGIPIVRVSMTDRDVIERVARLFDRAVVGLRARQPHYKRPFATTIKGGSAVGLMRAVRPFLGLPRQRQIDRAIATWHGRRPRSRQRSARCSVEGCARPGSTRGLCRRHYDRWWKSIRRGAPPAFVPQDSPIDAIVSFDSAGCSAECDLAWLAGLLEGEGTFGSYAGYPVLSLEMCDLDIVSRAAKILGAASVGLNVPDHAEWSPLYVAKISGSRAADWMRRVRPYMGARRIAAIDVALGEYHPIRLVEVPVTCVVPGCGKPHRSRGLCHAHYMAWSRDVKKGRQPRVTPLR
jgi:hypothetical protein